MHTARTMLIALTLALAAFALVAAVASAQDARPVDTLQFGLLQRGWSQATIERRLGPPAHVERDTRTVLVPLRSRHAFPSARRRAPAYGVRTTDVEWWYYPEGGGSMATVLEFRDGVLYAKDKYR